MVKKRPNREQASTTLDENLLREIKHLAIDEGCGYNELLEEGMRRVLQARKRKSRYESTNKTKKVSD